MPPLRQSQFFQQILRRAQTLCNDEDLTVLSCCLKQQQLESQTQSSHQIYSLAAADWPDTAPCSQVGASLGMQTKRDNIEIHTQGMTERMLVTENKASFVSSFIEQFIYCKRLQIQNQSDCFIYFFTFEDSNYSASEEHTTAALMSISYHLPRKSLY